MLQPLRFDLLGVAEDEERRHRPFLVHRQAPDHSELELLVQPARAFVVVEAALRQTLGQRLRLGDLRHLGRRRKAFERGREHGVRFGKPVGRLVELAKGKRSF